MAVMPNIKLPGVQLPSASAQKPGWRRLAWFFGIWAASAIAVALVSYTLKAIFSL